MTRNRRTALVPGAVVLAGALALAGCTSTPAGIEMDADTVVIDVRTAAEYDAGHLEDAVNYDVQSPGFAAQVATLDPEGSYVVYCRTGNRAGVAVDRLEDLGFDDVQNAGGLDDAARATGLDVIS
ncbi:rhodanese-like domain-containing protein [Cellulomonas sp. CW35]|uniref:rhodanese-like domain-containing protein n=1 Tax=Cellulomonas sp. CW35 TaxID=3458249 RepID=UPI0040334F70